MLKAVYAFSEFAFLSREHKPFVCVCDPLRSHISLKTNSGHKSQHLVIQSISVCALWAGSHMSSDLGLTPRWFVTGSSAAPDCCCKAHRIQEQLYWHCGPYKMGFQMHVLTPGPPLAQSPYMLVLQMRPKPNQLCASEGPPVVQPLDTFLAFYGTRRFITAFTRTLHWSLS
jgi:hypothetical protein